MSGCVNWKPEDNNSHDICADMNGKCTNYEPKPPEFEVGDWVFNIKDDKLACLKTSINVAHVKFRNTPPNVRFRHAKESDWWFERHGVKVMIEKTKTIAGIGGDQEARFRVVGGAHVMLCSYTYKELAQALDIPIKPYGWKEKG